MRIRIWISFLAAADEEASRLTINRIFPSGKGPWFPGETWKKQKDRRRPLSEGAAALFMCA